MMCIYFFRDERGTNPGMASAQENKGGGQQADTCGDQLLVSCYLQSGTGSAIRSPKYHVCQVKTMGRKFDISVRQPRVMLRGVRRVVVVVVSGNLIVSSPSQHHSKQYRDPEYHDLRVVM